MNEANQGPDVVTPLTILTFPDPILTRLSVAVENIDSTIMELSERMIFTVKATHNGVGLAAPQVGHLLRLVVLDPSYQPDDFFDLGSREPFVMINPEILESSGSYLDEEGCLSLPGLFYPVERAETVTVAYSDMEGNRTQVEATDFMAKLIQHEIDHLDGKLMWDRVSRFKREWLKMRYRKLLKNRE